MPSGKTRQAVLIERYTAMSQIEVARVLKISQERVGQIERSALKKLRAAFEKEGYEVRQQAIPLAHNLLRMLSAREREEWLFRILLADCDLSEAPLARLWKVQI